MNVSKTSRYRNRLLVSTAIAGAALLGFGQSADAACTAGAPPNYVCSGANTTGQIVPTGIGLPLDAVDLLTLLLAPANPTVTTSAGFSVTTTDPFALGILGKGAVSYTDANSSALSSTTGIGLGVVSLVPQIADPFYGPNPGGAVAIDTGGAISGALIGLAAINTGDGTTSVKATGDIKATDGYGAVIYSQGGDSTVETGKVTGTEGGIVALNQGATANLKVTADGDVVGGVVDGAGVVTGDGDGIRAVNGDLQVDVVNTIVSGTLTYETGPGTYAGHDLTVLAKGTATGGANGIYAYNNGTGATNVTAKGAVTGTSGNGIDAFGGGATTGDTTIDAKAVTGGTDGIHASNFGTGAIGVTATGAVIGSSRYGIYAYNGTTSTGDLTVDAMAVTGGTDGIYAVNNGTGATSVTAGGAVTGTSGSGIYASNSGTGLTVSAAAVNGRFGIAVTNSGTGATSITATGVVAGTSGNGIDAYNGATATSLTVEAVAVSGGFHGIHAENRGTGTISITATGVVQGSDAAISATSNGHAITITTDDLVQNSSGLTTDLAVETSGGPVNFTNKWVVKGTLKLGAAAGNIVTSRLWYAAGATSEFGGGTLINTEWIGAANFGATAPVTTTFNDLATFTNNGWLSMLNGIAGDVTRQIGGNAVFGAGSRLVVDLSGTGADKFTTTGTANITGSTLDVNVGGLAVGTYTVLTADSGLTGQFATVLGLTNTAFLAMTDDYDAKNAYLKVTKVRDFADAGLTPNQIATGEGLDSLSGGPLAGAVASLMTDAEARDAFDQLSGEIHASAKGMLVEDSRFIREAATSRIRAAFGGSGTTAAIPVMAYGEGGPEMVAADTDRFAVWGQAFGSWSNTDSDGNAAAIGRSTGGLVAGADTPVGGWRVGVLGGYSHSSFDADDRSSSGKADNYHLGLYGGTNWGAVAFRGGAAYSWSSLSTHRSVTFDGFADALSADYDAGAAQVFGELAYKADPGRLEFEPFANLAYVSVHTDGFTETGGAAALTSTGSTTDATFTTLGLRGSTELALDGVNATARGMLGWRHAFGDVTPLSSFNFAGGNAFAIAGVPFARDAAVIEVGLDLKMSAKAKLGLSYSGQFGGGAADQGAKVNLGLSF
ncbi:autotransporter outer membrane beta-barrel domain-containing protein [Mesorhizobium comanense]|uniref:autotransporter outer membrane beta-barrel domain-containing protein n=1 Tax=Mesorhizobium comanense TaxID=2502215 RepID=UPI0014858155|nr:autotransporter domain-containing protein [Mesorhizobium comanense]